MTAELIRQLMAAGLTKQQATSVTAETLTNLYMNEDGKMLIAEAHRQVSEMDKMVRALRSDYEYLKKQIESITGTLSAITKAQEEYGSVSDDKAKDVIALYAALLHMNEKAGADPSKSVENASYTIYAYLGGQARRDVRYNITNE